MLTLTRHLSEERLVAVAVASPATAREDVHLAHCAGCADRLARLAALLRDVSAVAADEADAAFPPARLASQRARILSRVGRITQPAAVLEFPAPTVLRALRPRRWLGAAASAAAGLLLGVAAGQAVRPATPPTSAAVETPAEVRGAPVVRPAAITISDDDLLLQIETAGRRPQPATLRSLDALTPRTTEFVSLR